MAKARAFTLGRQVEITAFVAGERERCYVHAVGELVRLLGRAGVESTLVHKPAKGRGLRLHIGVAPAVGSATFRALRDDGYVVAIAPEGVALVALVGKGVLNAVYDLAELLGFAFLLPGENGEWAPETPAALATDELVRLPRFPHRGVFWQKLGGADDYSVEEWLRFYAKLRFNALAHDLESLALAEELGLRLEIGGHGFAGLLPRGLFAERPELFRMFQPEDFGGKRNPDSNMCVTNSQTRALVKKNFAAKLDAAKGAYAWHQWADDLPSGGWCACPCCRSLTPRDQAALAMNLLAEAVREHGSDIKIPVLAYHDTMTPGTQISPAPECFPLFAPRERCYGHALDDPSCARNRHYLAALKAWTAKFGPGVDNHTFEYYFDQILFRGMYPFLPETILADMRVYEANGVQTHLALQVAGPEFVPELNMLFFAAAAWDAAVNPKRFRRAYAKAVCPVEPRPWEDYLKARAAVFTSAMRVCDYDLEVYLDYRWLPENTLPFGHKMAKAYAVAAEALEGAADKLAAAVGPVWTDRAKALADKEVKRARFEAAELVVMGFQQAALNCFGDYLDKGGKESAAEGVELMGKALEAFKTARKRAEEFGLPVKCWYFGNVNRWQSAEFEKKIQNYRGV